MAAAVALPLVVIFVNCGAWKKESDGVANCHQAMPATSAITATAAQTSFLGGRFRADGGACGAGLSSRRGDCDGAATFWHSALNAGCRDSGSKRQSTEVKRIHHSRLA